MGRETEDADEVLGPALRRLIERALEMGTTKTKPLAEDLGLSPHTVRTEWQRIGDALGTNSRFSSISVAVERKVIRWPKDGD